MSLKNGVGVFVILLVVSTGYAQEHFTGTVIEQRYVRLEFKSHVRLQKSVTLRIKRLELGRYSVPYAEHIDTFIHSLDVGAATPLSEIPLDSSEGFQYDDHKVKRGYTYVYWLESPGSELIAGPLCRKVRDPDVWWSQEKIERKMDDLTASYPSMVEKRTFGKTAIGNLINGLLVGRLDNAILLIGNTHAGESGAELHLYTIEHILAQNKDLLEKNGLIVVPVLNIDSRNRLIEGIAKYQRTNGNGVDLNRNYPVDWETVDSSYGVQSDDPFSGTYRGPSPGSEPETKTIIGIVETYKPKVVFDYHWMGCITGCNLLAYTSKTEMVPDLNRFAHYFYEGYHKGTPNPPKHRITKSTKSGTTQRYCAQEHHIPAYSVEGNRIDPILDRARSDMATEEDLSAYQQKHYHAILCVLQHLSHSEHIED
ncbi:MAG: hypothetical protein JXM79_03225 [Sedimentisphaerales bacterium]|nr:hypothetical protein [Sedimentisphaerales bacterium]